MTTCIHCHMNHYLTKFILSIFNKDEIKKSLSIAGKQLLACLHFQQILSIQVCLPLCLWVRIKTLKWLGYIVTSSISWGSTSTFKDDVSDKTSDSFTTRKAMFTLRDEGIHSLVHRYWKYILKCKESSAFIVTLSHESSSYQVCFEPFQ